MHWFGGKALKWSAGAAGLVGALIATIWIARPSPPPPAEEPPAGPVLFEDYTDKAGLHFVHDAGPLPHDGKYFMPQIMGSGAAAFDFDGDGLLDLYLLTNGGPQSPSTNRLFRQLPGGRFQDVSAGSGLDFAGYNMGVAIADV